MTGSDNPTVQNLLGGLEGSARKERAELITWLLQQGVTLDEIRRAPMPMLLASRRIVGDDDDYVSARQISEHVGVSVELVQRVQHALGRPWVDDPDAAAYLRADGEITAHLEKFHEAGLDPEHLIQVIHVVTEGLAPVAEVLRYTGLAAVFRLDASELEIAQRSQALVSRTTPLLGPWIADMLFAHLRNRTDTETITTGERTAGSLLPGARDVTVAFVDLAGFTRLGEIRPAEQLSELAHRLTDRARQVAVPPVRFIKTIGDAVMFLGTDPDPSSLLDAVLKLVETTDTGTDTLQLRAGVASGPAITRAGDWFGSPVNIASRVTAIAQPGTTLITEPVQHNLTEASGFDWSSVGPHPLKSIPSEVQLLHIWRKPDNIT